VIQPNNTKTTTRSTTQLNAETNQASNLKRNGKKKKKNEQQPENAENNKNEEEQTILLSTDVDDHGDDDYDTRFFEPIVITEQDNTLGHPIGEYVDQGDQVANTEKQLIMPRKRSQKQRKSRKSDTSDLENTEYIAPVIISNSDADTQPIIVTSTIETSNEPYQEAHSDDDAAQPMQHTVLAQTRNPMKSQTPAVFVTKEPSATWINAPLQPCPSTRLHPKPIIIELQSLSTSEDVTLNGTVTIRTALPSSLAAPACSGFLQFEGTIYPAPDALHVFLSTDGKTPNGPALTHALGNHYDTSAAYILPSAWKPGKYTSIVLYSYQTGVIASGTPKSKTTAWTALQQGGKDWNDKNHFVWPNGIHGGLEEQVGQPAASTPVMEAVTEDFLATTDPRTELSVIRKREREKIAKEQKAKQSVKRLNKGFLQESPSNASLPSVFLSFILIILSSIWMIE